jgi:hypothetical protein
MLRLAMVAVMGMLWSGEPPYPDDVPVTDGFLPRFPTEKEMSEEDKQMNRLEDKERGPVAPTDKANPCDTVAPEAQMSCPLSDKVVAIEPLPQGVRLLVHRGLPADQLREELTCQVSQARVRSDTPSCAFIGPGMDVAVRPQGKGTTAVDIVTSPPDAAKAGILQKRVEIAYPRARKASR